MRKSAPGVRFDNMYRTVSERQIIDMLSLRGWAYEKNHPDALTETKRVLDNLVDLGLGVQRGQIGERLFDPVEVTNVLKSAGLAGRDSFWASRCVRGGRQLVT